MLDINYSNKIIFPKGSTMNIRALPSTTSTILQTLNAGSPGGRTTGQISNMKDGRWFQIALYSPINDRKYAYAREDVAKFVTPATKQNKTAEENAKNILKDLIKNDQAVFKSIVLSAFYLKQAKAKGADVSKYEKTLLDLSNRYQARQSEIRNSKLFKYSAGVTSGLESYAKGYKNYLANATARPMRGIGAIIVDDMIIGGIILIAAAAVVYYAIMPRYDESKKDLVVSKELEKALSTLTPAEREKVQKDLNKQIDDAYNQGKTDQAWTGIKGTVKTIGLMALGFFAINKMMSYANKK